MSLRFQRLIVILASLVLITGSLILILNNYKKNIIFFYTPTELIKADANINQKVRIGGFVKQNSIKKIASLKTHITFIVTDKESDIFVEYKGILPDLFKEGQGAVIEGILINNNKIQADKVFAKHDENYMPVSIKKQLEETEYWKKDYPANSFLNENIPEFSSKGLIERNLIITNYEIKDKITIINFFASWCLPCKNEHPLFLSLKNQFPELMIVGFNYKDKNEDAIKFLSTNGNPYSFVGIDYDGRIGLEFGVLGLPETLLTNNQGKIIYRHIGPLSDEIILKKIIPNL